MAGLIKHIKMGREKQVQETTKNLTIAGHNIRSWTSGKRYVNNIMHKLHADIVFVAEHRLYKNELFKLKDFDDQYDVIAKSSEDLKLYNQNRVSGHCGVAMFWRYDMAWDVKEMECSSDRMCCIEVIGACKGKSLFVIGIYLPHQSCKITSFDSEIAVLSELVARYRHEGELVIIGDTNCHYGPEYGNRCWGKTTSNAKKLMRVVNACNMKVVDLEGSGCSGRNITFEMEAVGRSYIDHCIVSDGAECLLTSCEVISDDIMNLSDHVPIVASIALYVEARGAKNDEPVNRYIEWHRMSAKQIREVYRQPLESEVELLLKDLEKRGEDITMQIDRGFDRLVECIMRISVKLPQGKAFKSYQKPYWNKSLSKMAKENKSTWRQWVVRGRPRGNDIVFTKLKECKRAFRNAQREAEIAYEVEKMDDIAKCQELDARYFWHLVSKGRNQTRNRVQPIKVDKGQTAYSNSEIGDAWYQYFKKLFSIYEDPNNRYDECFEKRVKDKISKIVRESYESSENIISDISVTEVEEIIRRLKDRKAPGADCITNEHVKYGGNLLAVYITRLFEMIIRFEYVPRMFKIGIIIPIPKGDKNRWYMDNYRGITLTSVLAKMFEKFIVGRIDPWVKENNVIHSLQGVSQHHCSSLHSAWLVREALADNRERNKSVFVGLLDSKKAFDTVWQDGLFFKLYEIGLKGKTWRVLRYMFNNYKCVVRVGGDLTKEFRIERGIHQGSPCSMLLYALFINELIREINNDFVSMRSCGVSIGCAAYADDMVLMANSEEGLRRELDIASCYSRKWRFSFNPSKCSVVVFEKDKALRKDKFKMGKELIKVVDGEMHLGIWLSNSKTSNAEWLDKRIEACRNVCFAGQGIGSHRVPMTPKTSDKLYKAICIPKLTYGLEVVDINDVQATNLEAFNHDMAKMQQGLPRQCSNTGSVATMGRHSIKAHCDIMKIIFLWQLLCLPMSCIYKVVCVRRLCKILFFNKGNKGPIFRILEKCKEYGLYEHVKKALEYGKYMGKHKWKDKITPIIKTVDYKRRQVRYRMYISLRYLDTNSYNMCSWWVHSYNDYRYARKNRVVVKLLLNVFSYEERQCPLCEEYVTNDSPHVLFGCDSIRKEREIHWSRVLLCAPNDIISATEKMNDVKKTEFILNACYCKYVPECKMLYDSLSDFIYNMCIIYRKGMDRELRVVV